MFTGGAAAPAFKRAHALLPLPGQAYGASAEKQHGVSPLVVVFFSFGYVRHLNIENTYLFYLELNIIMKSLYSDLQLDSWLFHLKMDRS